MKKLNIRCILYVSALLAGLTILVSAFCAEAAQTRSLTNDVSVTIPDTWQFGEVLGSGALGMYEIDFRWNQNKDFYGHVDLTYMMEGETTGSAIEEAKRRADGWVEDIYDAEVGPIYPTTLGGREAAMFNVTSRYISYTQCVIIGVRGDATVTLYFSGPPGEIYQIQSDIDYVRQNFRW